MTPEFSRRYPLDTIGAAPRAVSIAADEGERAALATRFGLIALERLEADARLMAIAGGVEVRGTMRAHGVQACVVTGDPVEAALYEEFALRFVTSTPASEDEVELSDTDCDIIPIEGAAIDLGEAVAQTLGLTLDPFPRSAAAGSGEEQTWTAGAQGGSFAGLKDLLGG